MYLLCKLDKTRDSFTLRARNNSERVRRLNTRRDLNQLCTLLSHLVHYILY